MRTQQQLTCKHCGGAVTNPTTTVRMDRKKRITTGYIHPKCHELYTLKWQKFDFVWSVAQQLLLNLTVAE